MITLTYDDGGTEKSLVILAESFGELRPVMARFSKYMRAEIDAVFESRGGGEWADLAPATKAHNEGLKAAKVEKIRANKYGSLSAALRSEKRKAERRLAKTPASKSKLTERRRKAVAKYDAQLAEVARLSAGGEKDAKFGKKLYERVARREAKAQKKIEAVLSGQQLGRIANSFAIDFDKHNWEMRSRIPWAGVHNEGGTAGHGASIPARVFLEWTPARVEKFAEMANEYVISRASKAGKK